MNKKRFTLIAFVAIFALLFLMSAGTVPTLNTAEGVPITQDEIDRFGETLPNGTLYYPDLGFPTRNYLPSAEGTLHEDSILEFRETTDDNVLFYPDTFSLDNIVTATWGESGYVGNNPSGSGDYTDTQALGGDYWYQSVSGAGGGNESSWLYLDFAIPTGGTIEGITLNIEFDDLTGYGGTLLHNIIAIREGSTYTDFDDCVDGWVNTSVHYGTDFSNGTHIRVKLMLGGAQASYVAVDYIEVLYHIMTLADSEHYAESFADISDWDFHSSGSLGAGDYGFGTDGDVGEMWMVTDDTNNEYVFYKQAVNFLIEKDTVFEFRVKSESALTIISTRITGTDLDIWPGSTTSTSYTTLKAKLYISAGKTADWVYFFLDDISSDSAYGNYSGWLDYWRLGPSDEMGWQHDMSTTEGLGANYLSTSSSDGDKVTVTTTTDGYGRVVLYPDTTTTKTLIEVDHYPFLGISVSSTTAQWCIQAKWSDDTVTSAQGYTSATGLFHYNLKSFGAGKDYKELHIYVDQLTGDYTVFDWIKAYSIANFTVTQSDCDTNNYLYVDSGSLIASGSFGYFRLEHDPVVSVSKATYNVWNATLSSGASQFRFLERSSTWNYWDTGVTRGALKSTTLDDFDILFYDALEISAVKFWEDAVAPTISTFTNTPLDPNTASEVTIESIASDGQGVYTAKATAVVEPSGSSIGTVDMTLDYTTQGGAGIYSYTFSAGDLSEGRYTFELEVDDAANQVYEYLTFTVSAEITAYDCHIVILDSLYNLIPFDTFEVYVNDSRIYHDIIRVVDGYGYQIEVKNRYGDTVNSTAFGADREMIVFVNVYSLKFWSAYEGLCMLTISRGGVDYSEVLMPMEIVNFRLYRENYTYSIDYLDDTIMSGEINLLASTGVIITNDTISDIFGLIDAVWSMSDAINITVNTVADNTYLIQLMFDWTNTTLYNQSITIMAAFNWDNTTLYNQTISLMSAFNSTNTVLYNQIVLIQNMFNWENTTLFNQTISILNAFNATNTVIYEQTISILSEISSMNVTIYGQTVSLLNYIYYNSSSIYNQTIDVLTQLSLIGSNVTANYISVSASLVAIDSSLLSNFTAVTATLLAIDSSLLSNFTAVTSTLSAIGSNVTSNYLAVTAALILMDSNLLSNFTSVSAALTLIDSNLLSNFTDVTATLSAIGSNVTSNYLSVAATLSMLDSSLLSNFTSVSATLSLIDSNLLSNFTEVTATLSAIGSNITTKFLSVAATLSMLDSSLLSNFTSVSATLSMIDSQLLSNFTEVTSTLSAIGSNVTSNYLSVAATLSLLDSNLLSNFTSVSATLSLIDSNLLSNFTEVTATLSAIGSNITANYLSVAASLSAIDSNLLSNFTSISATLVLIDSNMLSNFTEVTATLSAIGSNVTSNYLSIVAELILIDSNLASNFTSITAQLIATNSSIITQTLEIISNLDALNATVYLVDDPTHLNPLVLGHSYSDEYCDLTIVTNWHNASISVYDNDVLRTGPTSELLCPIRYPLLDTSGTHNLSIYIDGGNDAFWYNISYTVAEIIAFEIEDWDVSPHLSTENYLECFFRTTWGNSTIYVYLNDTLQTSVLEQEGGISFSFWMSESSGLHQYVFNVTSGASVETITWDFYLPDWAETALVVRWDMWTYQNNYTLLTLESNWRNCTYHIYLDGFEVANATVDPVTLNFTRAINVGEYNLTIFADGGTQNYTILNIRYIVTEDGVTYDYSEVTTSHGVANTYETNNVYNYDNPPGFFATAETVAMVIVGILIGAVLLFMIVSRWLAVWRAKFSAKYS